MPAAACSTAFRGPWCKPSARRFSPTPRQPLDGVLELVVDEDELVRRTLARGREDDRPEVVRKRLDLFHKQTAPLSDYYRQRGLLHAIDGNGVPDEVFDRIKKVLKEIARSADVVDCGRRQSFRGTIRMRQRACTYFVPLAKSPRCAKPACWSGRPINWPARWSSRA